MAGHSKWANIKHRKGAQDAKKAKIFTRIIKEIMIATREGGGDPDSNSKLRLLIQNAKSANIPKENIARAIKKGIGEEGANLKEVTFEGHGPFGVALFVEATTDNTNRTVASVRAIFNKYGGELGKNGSLSFLFSHKSLISIDKKNIHNVSLEDLEMELIDAGLEEWNEEGENINILSKFTDFGQIQKTLESLSVPIVHSEFMRLPDSFVTVPSDKQSQIIKLIDAMEDNDDVGTVFHNMEMED